MSKNILIITGSLRRQSFNRQLADQVAAALDGKANVSRLDYADVPFINQDDEFPAPTAVARVREAVQAADGLWIVTPEYNFSYPGLLKNLLDWLSRPLAPGDFAGGTAISGKKATTSGAAGSSGAANVLAKLDELLRFIRADVMEGAPTGVVLGAEAFGTNVLTLTDADKQALQAQADAFVKFLEE